MSDYQKLLMKGSTKDLCEVKIVVLGAATVGKSSVTLRYINNEFHEDYDPTLQDKFKKNVDIDNT